MQVFVAGATGAVGAPTVRALVEAGHAVTGTSRDAGRIAIIERAGGRGVVADALDREAIARAVADAAPEAVVQLLTSLPPMGPKRPSDFAATNRLRTEGTANLIAAAQAAGVRRYLSESIVLGYGPTGDREATEADPFARAVEGGPFAAPIAALGSLESQVLAIGGVVLRFGLFYGETPATAAVEKMARRRMLRLPAGDGVLPWLHVEDAAAAVVAALARGVDGEAYNIVDDHPLGFGGFASAVAAATGTAPPGRLPRLVARVAAPYLLTMVALRLRVSNAKAKEQLGWAPAFPSVADGLRARTSAR